jgi:hypothetical protein
LAYNRTTGKFTMDAHGAGAQRSDPRAGDPADYPRGLGPQRDQIRIYNYVRCVRDVGRTTCRGSEPRASTTINTSEAPRAEGLPQCSFFPLLLFENRCILQS